MPHVQLRLVTAGLARLPDDALFLVREEGCFGVLALGTQDKLFDEDVQQLLQ